MEIVAFLLILIVCWIVLTLLDLAVSGVLSFFRGISFKRAFAWGLLSWVVPVLALEIGRASGRERV